MAVSKRVRYEVLRRDGFTCRYCHSAEAELTVDHVIPRALGGTDEPSNLVAACRDCNAGKSSTKPDESLVSDVKQEALAMGMALRRALDEKADELAKAKRRVGRIAKHWEETAAVAGCPWASMDPDWRLSVIRWQAVGVKDQIIEDAIDMAFSRNKVPPKAKWKYTCGIIWRTLEDSVARATGGGVKPEEGRNACGHCLACRNQEDPYYAGYCLVYDPPVEESIVCDVCGRADCLYAYGYDEGIQAGMQYEFSQHHEAIKHYRECPEVGHGS